MEYKITQAWHTGKSHREQGRPCQDKVCLERVESLFCAAMADGAGSARYSEYGAERVCAAVARAVCRRFEEFFRMGRAELAEALVEECLWDLSGMALPFEQLACTLQFFAAHRDGRYLAGHLGDGVQILVAADGTISVVSPPENGDHPWETWFVTGPGAEQHLRLRRGTLTQPGTLLMMSDGPSAALYRAQDGTPARGCAVIAGWLAREREEVVAEALRSNMRGLLAEKSGDDMSMTVIRWKPEEDRP